MYIRNSKENKEIAHKGNKNNQKYTRIRSINYRKKKKQLQKFKISTAGNESRMILDFTSMIKKKLNKMDIHTKNNLKSWKHQKEHNDKNDIAGGKYPGINVM